MKDFQTGGEYEDDHAAYNEDLGDRYSVDEIGLGSDLGLLTRIGFAEFRNGNDVEQQAGLDITANRVDSDKFPNSLKDVIEAPLQYSSLNVGDPNKPFYNNHVAQIQSSVINERAWVKSVSNALRVTSGGIRGISSGATLYYSPRSMRPRGSKPDWNFSILKEVQIKGARSSYIRAFKYK